ncbi:MAG: hypothetical protein LC130_33790 [Bryobacterales bacterium]|nr:hypothetical protein [Bryobacterales bacterium]MEB2363232.1 hypothetical protein [Bryobacterales bacterium]
MTEGTGFITVYRSADANAKEDAEAVYDLLSSADMNAVLLDEHAPGVFSGTYEVRVPPERAAEAEKLIEARIATGEQPVDTSHELDLETIFSAEGTTAEMEALGVKSILEANMIPTVLIGNSTLPVLRFEVRVAREYADAANRTLAEARAAGPEAAEEAQREAEDTVLGGSGI